MGVISPKLRNSAKGQACTFRIPGVCLHNTETTVLCHIGDETKGLGNKANDWSGAFGCYACHEAIDQRRLPAEDDLFYRLRALQRTWAVWIRMGLIVLPMSAEKTRPHKKFKGGSRKLQSRSSFEPRYSMDRAYTGDREDHDDQD